MLLFELDTWLRDLSSDFTLKGYLYGGVKLAKNTAPDKYVHTGYDIRFDSRSEFSLPDANIGKTSLFLELIRGDLCILIIKEKIF